VYVLLFLVQFLSPHHVLIPDTTDLKIPFQSKQFVKEVQKLKKTQAQKKKQESLKNSKKNDDDVKNSEISSISEGSDHITESDEEREIVHTLHASSPLDYLYSLTSVPITSYAIIRDVNYASAECGGRKRIPYLPQKSENNSSMLKFPAFSLCGDRDTTPLTDGMRWYRDRYPHTYSKLSSSRDPLSVSALFQLILRTQHPSKTLGSNLLVTSFLSSSMFFRNMQLPTLMKNFTSHQRRVTSPDFKPLPHVINSNVTTTSPILLSPSPSLSSSSSVSHKTSLPFFKLSDFFFFDSKIKEELVNVNPALSVFSLPNYMKVFSKPKIRRITHMWRRLESLVMYKICNGIETTNEMENRVIYNFNEKEGG
jgi:hypothetical protein